MDVIAPSVAILLCTYNGQEFLAQQLDSFAAQTHAQWTLFASDDGSTDRTMSVLKRYQLVWGEDKVVLTYGPARGYVSNFLSLVCRPDIQADHFAYSDQDDIWEPAKLESALRWLETVPRDVPALYCSRTRLVDENNLGIGFSPLFSRPPCFANALMQNIAGGNTMVFNAAARRLLQDAGADVQVITHDWWTYIAVTACGGRVFYDPQPTVRYRQHQANIIGVSSSIESRLSRMRLLVRGRFKDWGDMHVNALYRLAPHLTSENQELLALFSKSRRGQLVPRLIGFKRAGIYRQTRLSNLGLVIAAIFKKI